MIILYHPIQYNNILYCLIWNGTVYSDLNGRSFLLIRFQSCMCISRAQIIVFACFCRPYNGHNEQEGKRRLSTANPLPLAARLSENGALRRLLGPFWPEDGRILGT